MVGSAWLPGIHPAPNIQDAADIYELENLAADPEQRLEKAMWAIAPWEDRVMLDLGAGTGFHLARFQARARHVIAVEPHDPSRIRAMQRVARLGLERVSVMTGSAERLLLADSSIDVAHARFAYFFGPGSEAGLDELRRVIRPAGTAFIIDNDWHYGTFAGWLRRSSWCKHLDPDATEPFWTAQGFAVTRVASEWRFENRGDLEAVLRIEFPPDLVPQLLAEVSGSRLDYGYCLYHRTY